MTELNIGGKMTVELRDDQLYAKAKTGNKHWLAVLTDTCPTYNYEREFAMYQKPRTSNRDSGFADVEDGAVIEYVRYTHSGKNRKDRYYQLVGGEAHEIGEADVPAALEGEIIPDVGPDQETIDKLAELDGVGETIATNLAEAGFESVEDVEGADVSELEAVDGIGPATAETIVTNEEPDPTTDGGNEPVAVADGGVDYDDYEINIDDLEFDVKNSTKDSTNNIRYTLARVSGAKLWVHYSTTQTGPSEWTHHLKGIGTLSVEGVDLDTDTVVETIRDEADRRVRDDRDEWGETDDQLSDLAEQADDVAEALEKDWQQGCEIITDDHIYDGVVGVGNGRVWSGHVEEAYYHEAENVMRDLGIEDDEHRIVSDVVRQGLVEGVRKLRNRWLKPHLEYEARLEFDVEPWQLRAIELEQNSVLPERTSRVVAMLEAGIQRSAIADELGVNPSTITRQADRANRMIDEAKWTTENVEKQE